jgi:hypothetical protein
MRLLLLLLLCLLGMGLPLAAAEPAADAPAPDNDALAQDPNAPGKDGKILIPREFCGLYCLPGPMTKPTKRGPPPTPTAGKSLFNVSNAGVTLWQHLERVIWAKGRFDEKPDIRTVRIAMERIEALASTEDRSSWTLFGRDDRGHLVSLTFTRTKEGTGSLSYRGPNGPVLYTGRMYPRPAKPAAKKR